MGSSLARGTCKTGQGLLSRGLFSSPSSDRLGSVSELFMGRKTQIKSNKRDISKDAELKA